MQVPLNYQTLGEMDGGASRAIIDAAIADAIRDIDDRGEDDKPRKVEIILTMTRLDNGNVACHVEAAARVPRRRTAGTITQVQRRSGQAHLAFQVYDNDDPTQRTLDEAEDRNKKEDGK